MHIFSKAIELYLKNRIQRIKRAVQNPYTTQRSVFLELTENARNTQFGIEHGFGKIKNFHDFKKQVPIRSYEEMKPYFKRIMKGEQNVTWPSKINCFAKSSGTTGDKSKFVPVSKDALADCHFRGGKDVMTLYFSQIRESQVLRGKCLVLGGSTGINNINTGSYYGDISALMLKNLPFIARKNRIPNIEIALMDDWEEKIERMAEASIGENVTYLAGIPSWTIVLIKKIFELTGASDLHEVWPKLELYIHGGVNFEPYRQYFQTVTKRPLYFLDTYNASEGFFALQDQAGSSDMLLALDYGIFFEFLPLRSAGSSNSQTLQLHEIEPHVDYELVISTNSGLWRYRLGDTVKFTNVKPLRIRVTGRTKHYINAVGEEVMIHNTDRAISEACRKTGAILREYTVAPVYFRQLEKPRHEWIIEFETPPGNLTHFTQSLDEQLQNVNSDYEAKRFRDMVLQQPIVKVANEGTFQRWLHQNGKLGGQHKVQRLSNNRQFIEELERFF